MFLKSADVVVAGLRVQRQENDGRILMGDNTGGGEGARYVVADHVLQSRSQLDSPAHS